MKTPTKASGIPRLSKVPVARFTRKETNADSPESRKIYPSQRLKENKPTAINPKRTAGEGTRTKITSTQRPVPADLCISFLDVDSNRLGRSPPKSTKFLSTSPQRMSGKEKEDIPRERRPRPSLSDRTIETLSQIPPSPSLRRRKSLYPDLSVTPTTPRSKFAMGGPRPATSHGPIRTAPPLPQKVLSPGKELPGNGKTSTSESPARRAVSSSIPRGSPKVRPLPSVDQDIMNALAKDSEFQKAPPSSKALRETIAKARAAKVAATKHATKQSSLTSGFRPAAAPQVSTETEEWSFTDDVESTLQQRIGAARTEGRLNIAALGLKNFPKEVQKMYDAKEGTWYESVDLVRINAADNEIEELPEDYFPSEDHFEEDADTNSNVLAGLGTLNLHGNKLKALPIGLGRLEHLKILNLSKNSFEGTFPPPILQLVCLEVLNFQDNNLTDVPNAINYLYNLRVLDVAGNKLLSLPMDSLASLPLLVSINASRNRLSGPFFSSTIASSFVKLESLDISTNAITSLSESANLCLSFLRDLNISSNRLSYLPANISEWTALQTIIASDNAYTSIPEELLELQLKVMDFSRCHIRNLDERLGLMKALEVLKITDNPLRERKFFKMGIAEIREELRLRIVGAEGDGNGEAASG